MHACTALAQAGGLVKYGIPASNMSCLVPHRLMMVFTILYNVTTRQTTAALLEIRLVLLGFFLSGTIFE